VWLVLACLTCATLTKQSGRLRSLTTLHLNDLHARLQPDSDGLGGFAHLATVLARERAATGASLTLHAGDLVQVGQP
jgi:2',3'-cyclic-nucleotide 2'-phosphodiesterase (5'-nucleotidase family)